MQPEEQIASREIYDGRIIKVRVDDILLTESGRQSVREVVEHAPAVVIVPVDADGNVLLVRQYRYAAKQTLLEAPAGIVEHGEDPGRMRPARACRRDRLCVPKPARPRRLLGIPRLLR